MDGRGVGDFVFFPSLSELFVRLGIGDRGQVRGLGGGGGVTPGIFFFSFFSIFVGG